MTDETVAQATAPVETPVAETPVEQAESTPAADVVPSEVPKRNREQERYDELTREKYDARRERDQERFRREAVEAELNELRKKAQTTPVAPAEFPTLESVGYDENKFHVAVAEFTREAAAKEAARVLNEDRAKSQKQTLEQTWQQRQAEFAKSKPDYFDKVANNQHLPISPDMARVLMASEMGVQVAYYLGDHMDQARHIAMLSDPLDQAREIGRIEARLEAQKAAPVAVSKAPPPPPKLETADPKVDKSPDQMTDKEFATWRKRQIAQRR